MKMPINPPPAVFTWRVVDNHLVRIEIEGDQHPIAKNLVLLMLQQVIHLWLGAIHRAAAMNVVSRPNNLIAAELAAIIGAQKRRKFRGNQRLSVCSCYRRRARYPSAPYSRVRLKTERGGHHEHPPLTRHADLVCVAVTAIGVELVGGNPSCPPQQRVHLLCVKHHYLPIDGMTSKAVQSRPYPGLSELVIAWQDDKWNTRCRKIFPIHLRAALHSTIS
jgi:hypothetical protein